MSTIHFFTNPDSILQIQQSDFAFGKMTDVGDYERYNLENKFTVEENAPAYALCKSLLLMTVDSTDPSLLNIALIPLVNYGGGLPVKFIIYRGIKKSEIYDSNGFINTPDGTWSEKNILKTIHDLQDKINSQSGTSNDATSDCLGIQFGTLPSETLIEHIFYDDLDFFHPLIIEGGCQIGKFTGGVKTAGIEVLLDKVGSDATLGILKSNSHILEIQKININESLPEKEKIKIRFKNRLIKEDILAYMDITALYGACVNQGIKISGVSGSNFLDSFANRNSIYIDIRDERGYSYNHFFRTDDDVKIGFDVTAEETPVFSDYDYYNSWPILKLENLSYTTDKEKFYLKIPIISTAFQNTLILTSYSGRVALGTGNSNGEYYNKLNTVDKNGNVITDYTEEIQLNNWKDSSNKLGCNYFLLKLDTIGSIVQGDILSPIWDCFFSLKMTPFQGIENIPEGELRIRTYSSINSPLLVDNNNNRIFVPTVGLAIDKHHVSFFVFYHDTSYNAYAEQDNNFPIEYLGTGKFMFYYNTADLNYDENLEQSVGFLYYITQLKEKGIKNYRLNKYVFDDIDNNLSQEKFVKYVKEGIIDKRDNFFDNFEVITLTHSEYTALIDASNIVLSNNDYVSEHPSFIRSKDINKYDYPKFSFIKNSITIGVPKIETEDNENEVYISLVEYPESIEIDNEEITLNSVVLN